MNESRSAKVMSEALGEPSEASGVKRSGMDHGAVPSLDLCRIERESIRAESGETEVELQHPERRRAGDDTGDGEGDDADRLACGARGCWEQLAQATASRLRRLGRRGGGTPAATTHTCTHTFTHTFD